MCKWYVYRENFNKKTIEKFNIITKDFIDKFKQWKKDYVTKESVAAQIESYLMYYYWSKSEYEIVLTSFPPYIKCEELHYLIKRRDKHFEEWEDYPNVLIPQLTVEEKIDIYDQVMLNWDAFIDYVWENLK